MIVHPTGRNPTLGYCIYCPTPKGQLTRDHVVPQALGGRESLKEGCCEDCRSRLNRLVDDPSISLCFMAPNTHFQVPTPKRAPRPHTLPFRYSLPKSPTELKTLRVRVDQHPGVLALFSTLPPGILTGRPRTEEFLARGDHAYFSPDFRERINALVPNCIFWESASTMHPFARMSAKIAHAWAYYVLHDQGGFEPILLDVIEGRDKCLPHYFGGGEPRYDLAAEGENYGIQLRIEDAWVIVDLQLFAKQKMPTYQIVAGRVPASS